MNHIRTVSLATNSNNMALHIGYWNECKPGEPCQNECNPSELGNADEAGTVAYVHLLFCIW